MTVSERISGPVIYASFFQDELLTVRREEPMAQTMALIEAVPVNQTACATDAQATHVGVAFEMLAASFLKTLHDYSLRVFVYTVNKLADIQMVTTMGVDGIISDYLERLLQALPGRVRRYIELQRRTRVTSHSDG
ncbi:MAG: hypothetical protein MRJ68_03115 [Nitrospira sp.]|nr:hypothetical protein [Nitrospira sp.]